MEDVSWLDAVNFCNKLSDKEGLKPFYEIDGDGVRVADWSRPGYRLPTEAEWEYACRANAPTRYSFGDDATSLGEFAWYDGNSGSKTHPVGEKRPNGFGLFDMHGNVWEWCWDGCDAYKASRVDDPTGLDGAALRVIRGGSWVNDARVVRGVPRRLRAFGTGATTWAFAVPEFSLVAESKQVRRSGVVERAGQPGKTTVSIRNGRKPMASAATQ